MDLFSKQSTRNLEYLDWQKKAIWYIKQKKDFQKSIENLEI